MFYVKDASRGCSFSEFGSKPQCVYKHYKIVELGHETLDNFNQNQFMIESKWTFDPKLK